MFAGEALTQEKAEKVVRWYFYAGCCGLPWLWIVNYLFFRRFAAESVVIATYIRRSLYMGIAGLALIAAWILGAHMWLSSASSLWVIRPDGTWQSGYFAQSVYQQT